MAKTYTAKLEVKNWKEHTCVGCGGTYTYLLTRNVQGTGRSADQARANLQKQIGRTLERETELQPCPTCGLYQPDMIGQRKARKITVVFWLALVAFATAWILEATHVLQANTTTWVMVVIGGLAALRLLTISQDNPNSDVEANRQLTQPRVAAGELRQTPGQPGPAVDEWARPMRSPLIILLLMGAIVPLAAPEMIRSSRSWPINKDSYPPVVGPGDVTRVYMPEKITSIKDYWRGRPKAVLHDVGAKAGQGMPVSVTTNENDWGTTIYAKSSEKNSTSTPWVTLTMPTDASLAGKTMTAEIDLDLEYPVSSGSSKFVREHRTMHQSTNIHFAPPGAGASYSQMWWEGTFVGIVAILVGSLFLMGSAKGFVRRAKPTKIVA